MSEHLDLVALSEAHRTSYPMGNIHHGTPDSPGWGPFCVGCKQSWPCETSALIALIARVEATEAALERVRQAESERWKAVDFYLPSRNEVLEAHFPHATTTNRPPETDEENADG